MPESQDPPATVLDTSPISLPPADALCVVCGAPTDGDPVDMRCVECRAHGNVNPAAEPPQPTPTAPTLQQPTHVRVGGGQAGLRVQHFEGGVTTHKRVSAIDPPSSDHTLVPKEILSEVKRLLDESTSPAVAVMNVRELLDPWL